MKLFEILRLKDGDIYKLNHNASIADAATAMVDYGVGALLVEDDKETVVGILSERDIVGGMGEHGANLQDVRVSELMTSKLIRCSPTDTVLQSMALMTDRRIRHLPVFDGDELMGVISIGDLVKCRISEVQAEAEAMRQYIAS